MAEQKKGMVRRRFLKQAAGTAAVAGSASMLEKTSVLPEARAEKFTGRQAILSSLGDTLIPSDPGDPGYRDFEWYGITQEVMQGLSGLSDEDLDLFNQESHSFFDGRAFLDLGEDERAAYLNLIIDGSRFKDKQVLLKLQNVFRLARVRILTVFYQNFPENQVPRDRDNLPILRSSDAHQITSPNTSNLVTAWDTSEFRGPLRWSEEEERRALVRKIRWEE